MKNPYLLLVILIGSLMGFQSCSKQSHDQMLTSPPSPVILNATISANQTYQLTLDNSVKVGILKQASHFEVSQTELDTKNGLMVYKYIPTINYTGTDEVVLSTITATNVARTGCGSSQDVSSNNVAYTTSYTTLKINVTEK